MSSHASFPGLVFAGLVLFGLLKGCNPAPHYVRPMVQTPVAFKEAAPEQYKEGTGWKIAQPGDDKIRANWWEIYDDPQDTQRTGATSPGVESDHSGGGGQLPPGTGPGGFGAVAAFPDSFGVRVLYQLALFLDFAERARHRRGEFEHIQRGRHVDFGFDFLGERGLGDRPAPAC